MFEHMSASQKIVLCNPALHYSDMQEKCFQWRDQSEEMNRHQWWGGKAEILSCMSYI